MRVEGYFQKKPDPDWWLDQIKAGETYRKNCTYQDKWPNWRKYYRGDWAEDMIPLNLFYSMVRSTVPRVYFRNPTVSITPAKPGMMHMAFAKILERTDNKLIRQMKLKNQMKRTVQNAFMFGTGGIKVGYGGVHMPTPSFDPTVDMSGKDDRGHSTEFLNSAESNMPWAMNTHPGRIVIPAGAESFDDIPWTATEVIRPLNDVQRDPRLNSNKNKIKSFTVESPGEHMQIQRKRKMCKLYEVRDMRTHRVFIIAPDVESKSGSAKSKVLFDGLDEFQVVGLNTIPLIFNEDDERAWGVPDSQILEPYQKEINEIKTQIMKHRRLSLVKLIARRNSIKPEEAAKLVSETVLPVVFTESDPRMAVDKLQASNIPQDLIQAAAELMQDVREAVGFSRNQMGEYNSRSGDTTATEAKIVQSATEIRIDERRDMVADMLTSVMEHVNTVIFNHWTQKEVVEVVGPGGAPVWVQFQGELLRKGQYQIKVDPDSAMPESRDMREQRALELYQVLKTNPMIDPQKLTQYLLTELRGTAFDDMMKMMPMVNGPEQAVSPPDFANMIGQSAQQMSQQGPTPPRGAQ